MSLKEYNLKLKEDSKKRINEYNSNPNLCMFCGNPIYIKENEKYKDVIRKKFCSRSCASKYGHKYHERNQSKINRFSKIDNFTDEELIYSYNDSKSIKDLENKIGFKNICSQNRVIDRFLSLGLEVNDLKDDITSVMSSTKQKIFLSHNWQSARSAIQRLARKIYDKSSKPKKCVVCGYDKHYEVAHIKFVSSFDDNALISEINDIDNLIALCPNHHWEYDNDNLDINEYLS